jgi:hypothetical protein
LVPTLIIQNTPVRNRLTTLVRIIVAIPWLLVAALWGIGALCVAIVAWFVLLFTGRWPAGWWNFVAGFVRFDARATAFLLLLADPLPPFDGAEHPEYPIQLQVAPQQSYDRLKVGLRILYVIPAYLVAVVLGYLSYVIGFVSWVAILITGRQPDGLQAALAFCFSWSMRLMLLMTLLSETYAINIA